MTPRLGWRVVDLVGIGQRNPSESTVRLPRRIQVRALEGRKMVQNYNGVDGMESGARMLSKVLSVMTKWSQTYSQETKSKILLKLRCNFAL